MARDTAIMVVDHMRITTMARDTIVAITGTTTLGNDV
jgi:hypothetical protein